jgi:hypothetical protein
MGSLTATDVADYFGVSPQKLREWARTVSFPQPIPTPEGFLYREADINVWLFWLHQRAVAHERCATEAEIDFCNPEPDYGALLYIDPIDATWVTANGRG